jgi:hypothetical protein
LARKSIDRAIQMFGSFRDNLFAVIWDGKNHLEKLRVIPTLTAVPNFPLRGLPG